MSIIFDSHLDYHVNISYGNACVPATISQHKHTFRWKMCGNLEKSQFHWVRKVNENNTIVQLLFFVCVWVEHTTLYLVLRLCQGSLDLAEDQINVCTRHENICSMTISNFRFCRHLNVYLTTHIFTFTQLLCSAVRGVNSIYSPSHAFTHASNHNLSGGEKKHHAHAHRV